MTTETPIPCSTPDCPNPAHPLYSGTCEDCWIGRQATTQRESQHWLDRLRRRANEARHRTPKSKP